MFVADPLKESAREALSALRASGVRVVMASGDARTTAEAVARSLGIDEVHAELQPADKEALIVHPWSSGRRVAMAGDGANDAPALARASIGIAMGAGSDVAVESATIALVRGDLTASYAPGAPVASDDEEHLAEPRIRFPLPTCSAYPWLRACSTPSSVSCSRRCSPERP